MDASVCLNVWSATGCENRMLATVTVAENNVEKRINTSPSVWPRKLILIDLKTLYFCYSASS